MTSILDVPTILSDKIENSKTKTENEDKTNKEFEETAVKRVYHMGDIITY